MMKKIYIIDALMIVGTILTIFGTLGYFGYLDPLIIAPVDNLVTSNTSVLFSFEKADIIYSDASDLIDLFNQNPHIGYIFMRNLSTVVSSRLAEYRHKFGVELAISIKKEW